jgi:hypothetical protein
MSLNAGEVFLYAATPNDFEMALGAAGATGIPLSQMSGDFIQAWNTIATGSHLVIAVGGAALYALYYNPCNWANPASQSGGHTPFALTPVPTDVLPGPNYFVNASGPLAQDTYLATVLLAYYALHGQYPAKMQPLPKLLNPMSECPSSATNQVQIQC